MLLPFFLNNSSMCFHNFRIRSFYFSFKIVRFHAKIQGGKKVVRDRVTVNANY